MALKMLYIKAVRSKLLKGTMSGNYGDEGSVRVQDAGVTMRDDGVLE